MTDADELPDDIQDDIVAVNNLLESALHHANIYVGNDDVRPSAVRGFEDVQRAHERLSAVDPTRDETDERPPERREP